jgi:hypothetical protein
MRSTVCTRCYSSCSLLVACVLLPLGSCASLALEALECFVVVFLCCTQHARMSSKLRATSTSTTDAGPLLLCCVCDR